MIRRLLPFLLVIQIHAQITKQLNNASNITIGTLPASVLGTIPIPCNAITFSEQISNAGWTKFNTTVTADAAVAPDGNTTADLMASNTTSAANHRVSQAFTVPAGTYTMSIYAKRAVNTKRIMIREDAVTGATASFDLSTGAYLAGAAGGTGAITPLANSWYRISMTGTYAAGSPGFAVYLMPDTGTVFADASYASAVGDGFDLWGAAVVAGSVPGTYTVSTVQGGCFFSTPNGATIGIPINGLQTGDCVSSAAPAVCAAASSGSVVVAAAATTVVVNTTAVTAASKIFLMYDSSQGTRLGVTCNVTEPALYGVTARVANTSFTITSSAPTTNPACFSYLIM